MGQDIPQSLCIRIGNYLESFFNELIPNNALELLDKHNGMYGIWVDDEFHQIDHFIRTDGGLHMRELKCNLDLDRGKKRDVRTREHTIVTALRIKFDEPVDACVFCPFLKISREVSGLGIVEGLHRFITRFNLDLSVEEFMALGRNEQILRELLA